MAGCQCLQLRQRHDIDPDEAGSARGRVVRTDVHGKDATIRPAAEALRPQDAPQAVAVDRRQDTHQQAGQVVEREVQPALQGTDRIPLRRAGLCGQPVGAGGAVLAIRLPPPLPFADGLGTDAVAGSQHAHQLGGAGDLLARGGVGAGVPVRPHGWPGSGGPQVFVHRCRTGSLRQQCPAMKTQ